ncbi:MAG: O-antigen ligase family protein [Candidatus Thiodiazotropha sp. (ex Lucinoma borealis)]|nr:O-antigen ligase family protein [Candidatus Thiodiazotropha sp. (ex Lucinoma borealis)]
MDNLTIYLFPLSLLAILGLIYSLNNYISLLAYHLIIRSVFDSAHSITYKPILGFLTLGQLFSFFYIFIFIVYIINKKSNLQSTLLRPVLLLVVISTISAMFSGHWSGYVIFVTKWLYFYIIFVIAYDLSKNNSQKIIALVLFVATIYPIVNQLILSFVIEPKCVIGQPICSYIGTFYHESELSSWILMFLLGVSIGVKVGNGLVRYFYLSMFVIGVVSLILNGYRTAVLGFFVFLAVIFIASLKRMNVVSVFASILAIVIGVLLFGYISYDSVSVYTNDVLIFIKNPSEYFSIAGDVEKYDLFSGRLYIFNLVIREYINAGLIEYFFGIGPDVVVKNLGFFAHNEFISTFVELGLFGFFVFIWLLLAAWKIVRQSNDIVLFAMFVCVLVTALATMPFHDIRAIIVFALVIGFAKGKQARALRNGKY